MAPQPPGISAAAPRNWRSASPAALGFICLALLDHGSFASPNHDEVQAATEMQTSYQIYTEGRRLNTAVGPETCEQIHMKPMEPIRIGYEILEVQGVDAKQAAHIENVILRRAINYWSRTLKVHRAAAPLKAEYKGNGCLKYGLGFREWVLADSPLSCTSASLPTCGEGSQIPEKYLKSMTVCQKRCPRFFETLEHVITKKGGPPCESCTTMPGGPGVVGYDFMALVTIKDSKFCNGATQAHATACVKDQCDRPIFGWINFCTSMISLDPKDTDRQVSTAIHEMAHSLAFTSHLFGYYRNADGTPKLPRDPRDPSQLRDAVHWSCQGTSYAWNDPKGHRIYVDLSKGGIVMKFNERGIDSCPCPIGLPNLYPGCIQDPMAFREPNCVVKLTTPKVQEEVRNFFNCPMLPGAELENQPTSGCVIVGSHWEERIFMGELMTSGQFGDYIFLSRVTLAVFEDSGWYQPDYNMADPLVKGVHWGYGLGCSFALDKCVQNGKTEFPRFWCTKQGARKCSLLRKEELMCTMNKAPTALKPSYTFFNNSFIGDTAEADFCPYYHTPISNHICTDPHSATFPISNVNFMREVFGSDSRCLESTLRADIREGEGLYQPEPSMFAEPRAGCFKVVCSADGQSYDVFVSNLKKGAVKLGTCKEDGQALRTRWLQGQITCAPSWELCSVGLGRSQHTSVLYEEDEDRPSQYERFFDKRGRWTLAAAALASTGMVAFASVALARRCSKRRPLGATAFQLVHTIEYSPEDSARCAPGKAEDTSE